jgi:hypothetical protein
VTEAIKPKRETSIHWIINYVDISLPIKPRTLVRVLGNLNPESLSRRHLRAKPRALCRDVDCCGKIRALARTPNRIRGNDRNSDSKCEDINLIVSELLPIQGRCVCTDINL